jgi:hypothetical protein
MTAEELNELITTEGVDRVIADIIKRGYYVKQLATESPLPDELVVRGTVRLMDALGLPLANHAVTIETLRTAVPVQDNDGNVFYIGESQSRRHYVLNADGVLSVKLVRGSHVIIHIEGGFSREITVPNEDFDILAQKADDGFLNPAGPITLPIRRV